MGRTGRYKNGLTVIMSSFCLTCPRLYTAGGGVTKPLHGLGPDQHYPLWRPIEPVTLPPPWNPGWPQAGASGKRWRQSWFSSQVANEAGRPDHWTSNCWTTEELRVTSLVLMTATGRSSAEWSTGIEDKSELTCTWGANMFLQLWDMDYWMNFHIRWKIQFISHFAHML